MAAAKRTGIVIVGAGIAGASAVDTLRREGYGGRILLVGAETELPYERPPLSKDYLLGTTSEARLFPHTREYYRQQEVELYLGARASALDAHMREVEIEHGERRERIAFDQLLIATGSEEVRLRIPGAELPGIRYLRTLADARVLRAAMSEAAATHGRAVVVGGGFIGAEAAAACRALGLDVTLVEILPAPMARALGDELGDIFSAIHRRHGVDLRLNEGAAAFHGNGRVEEVVTTSGARIPCAFALVGVGVRPHTGWLEESGVALGDGVLVDEHCASSVPGVYAAGDVANWPYRAAGSDSAVRVRLEHWDNALRQSEVAARNLLGKDVTFAPVPYFWSDQYDLKLQYVGYARTWEHVVLRGDPATGAFAAFYLADGRVRAALGVNHVRDLVALKRLIGVEVEAKRLADESVDLRSLAPRPAARG